jgi:threonine/homoserine/homoserine lactone efflux protein
MNLEESRDQLGINDGDMSAIRRAKDPNWLIRGIITLVVILASFLSGVALGAANPPSAYPFAASFTPLVRSGKIRIPWLFIAVLAVISFVSLSIGVAANSESFGVTTYYGAFSRKD